MLCCVSHIYPTQIVLCYLNCYVFFPTSVLSSHFEHAAFFLQVIWDAFLLTDLDGLVKKLYHNTGETDFAYDFKFNNMSIGFMCV